MTERLTAQEAVTISQKANHELTMAYVAIERNANKGRFWAKVQANKLATIAALKAGGFKITPTSAHEPSTIVTWRPHETPYNHIPAADADDVEPIGVTNAK